MMFYFPKILERLSFLFVELHLVQTQFIISWPIVSRGGFSLSEILFNTHNTDTRKITVNIWIITGATRKITVCSSTFYSVLQYILQYTPVHFTVWHSKNYIFVKITGMNRKNYGLLQYILRCNTVIFIFYTTKKYCVPFLAIYRHPTSCD